MSMKEAIKTIIQVLLYPTILIAASITILVIFNSLIVKLIAVGLAMAAGAILFMMWEDSLTQ